MITLNLTANTEPEKRVLEYLQNNASETLAEKINNGTPFEKDDNTLINKKTLSDFMKYACDEAKKLAENGANSACIDDSTVFGWAIHFFEEESIEGALYTIDGEKYKPAPKISTTKNDVIKPPKKDTKPKQTQFSLFDFITEQDNTDEKDLTNENETVTEEETQAPAPQQTTEKPKISTMYQKYVTYQDEYPTAIVAYRLGDFYEVLGNNAVTLGNEIGLTITGREVGLKDRIPMVGFPYHAAENYFAKIVKNHDLYIIENDNEKQFIKSIKKMDCTVINNETGEILDTDDTDNEIITKLKKLLGKNTEIII